MCTSSDLTRVEAEVDEAFADNPLAKLPFAQSAWTLLSAVEDHHLKIKVLAPLEAAEAAMYADGLMNVLTYPLRVCHKRAAKGPVQLKRELIDEHYALAQDWLDAAKDYSHFCSIFPLYHAGQIDLRVDGHNLIPTDWSTTDLSYEVYDRFVARRDPEREEILDPSLVQAELRAAMRVSGGVYSVNFTRRIMDQLDSAFGTALTNRHTLPEDWQFAHFSLAQFRRIVTCLQAMACGWFLARILAAEDGAPALAFNSAVWTLNKHQLVAKLARHTSIQKAVVSHILLYLTFGEVGIRHPDIAIQPLIDLTNGQYAISPFVFTHVNSERNLCVLLNQIPSERTLYLQLVSAKENIVRSEIIASLAGLALDFRHGRIKGTDVDLAIIDRKTKKCLCIEIKWFIEPAEIREVLARSEELAKGVTQAQKIAHAFRDRDARLLSLLEVDPSYDFLAMVGSINFIGSHRTQHPEVPITKLWHLASEIRKRAGLSGVLEWLRSRSYLPRKDQDYRIIEVPIKSGQWRSRWYGIAHAEPFHRGPPLA